MFYIQYAGNPVSCAIALAVLDVIRDEHLMEHALEVGGYLKAEALRLMEKHPTIGEVR